MTFYCSGETLIEGSEPTDETHPVNAEGLVAGWGRCHSCNCRGFRSRPAKDNICDTCGHHWERHWD
jgi:hypothetical protein